MKRGLYHLLRVFFAVALFAASLGKLLDNRAFALVLADYRVGLPEPLLPWLGLGIALAELCLGLALMLGIRPRIGAIVLAAMVAGYSGVALVTLQRNLQLADCGCFGVFASVPVGSELLAIDAVLLALALMYCLAAWRHGGPRQRNVFRAGP